MDYLWYDMDEVAHFHPHVEECLKKAINVLGLDEELSVVHHPTIPGSTIPDFGVVLKRTNQYIFILEVKRNKQSVESERFWIQTKGYISALSNQWLTGSPKYFAITNLEETIVFADRNEHVNRCLLKGNPIIHGRFIKRDQNNFTQLKENFIQSLASMLGVAYRRENPQFTDNWLILVDSFYSTYQHIYSGLTITDKLKKRDLSLYELLRFLFFYYLKEVYNLTNHTNRTVFRNIDYTTTDPTTFTTSVINNFQRVLSIDFEQIFRPYGGVERIIPDHININQLGEFKKFLQKLDQYFAQAISENSSPSIFFNLITEKIYSKEELHSEGKIMTDKPLANLLSELTIISKESNVIDAGSGDGSLLDAAYEKISYLYQDAGDAKTHNEIMSQLHGYEIDSFLNQLATFRLVSKNLGAVNRETQIDLCVGDTFETPRPSEFDVVLMNPPFLRSDDADSPFPESRKEYMLSQIERSLPGTSFIREAKQPNLYFYFVNWIFHYLKDNGRAGLILMAKFLNNLDGVFLKEYLKESIESIIIYPQGYFSEFKVTTCLVILQKNSPQTHINFLKIIKPTLLEDSQKIKQILEGGEEINADYTLRKISKHTLNASDNWKLYLIDPRDNYKKIEKISILKPIKGGLFGEVKRGSTDNSGGSKTLYLNPRDVLQQHFNKIPETYVGVGFQNNKLGTNQRRHFKIRDGELEFEKAILFPSSFNNLPQQNLPENFKLFLVEAENLYTPAKWKKMVDGSFNSSVKVDILIPRAEREKHAIYVLNGGKTVVVSTNFFYCSELVNMQIEKEKALKVIGGYMLSSFGQIQFELVGNNQEGMRKLEGFMIDQLNALDPRDLTSDEIESLVLAFDNFDNQNVDVKGDEGITTSRRALDLAIASVILSHEDIGFSSEEELADFAELFLEELVVDRKT